MIHFLPEAAMEAAYPADCEALARIAGLRRALRLIDPFAGPAPDEDPAAGFSEFASESARRCFERRSERAIAAAASGLEVVAAQRAAGLEPHAASLNLLAKEIRGALADLSSLVRA